MNGKEFAPYKLCCSFTTANLKFVCSWQHYPADFSVLVVLLQGRYFYPNEEIVSTGSASRTWERDPKCDNKDTSILAATKWMRLVNVQHGTEEAS